MFEILLQIILLLLGLAIVILNDMWLRVPRKTGKHDVINRQVAGIHPPDPGELARRLTHDWERAKEHDWWDYDFGDFGDFGF